MKVWAIEPQYWNSGKTNWKSVLVSSVTIIGAFTVEDSYAGVGMLFCRFQ